MSSPDVIATVERALVAEFGEFPQRASVSFVGVEPMEVLRFEPVPDERVYVSLGMSRHPMTGAEASVMSSDGPRGELLLRLRDPVDGQVSVWRRLAVLAAAPVVEGVVYAQGMSVDLGEPLTPASACTGVVVAEAPLPAVETAAGPVALFRLLPATSAELAWCRVRGTGALVDRWTAAGTDLLDLGRRAVSLA